jgi:hypothetical protein
MARAQRHETQLVFAVRDALLATGRVQVWRLNTGGIKVDGRFVRFGFGAGGPDLVCILRPSGRFLGFEVKDGEPESQEQRCWREAANASGAAVFLVRSVDEALAALGSLT